MTAVTEQNLGKYLETFSRFEKNATGRDLPWLAALRGKGLARFCQVGFPTTRVEDWRFTDLSPLVRTAFELPGTLQNGPSREQIQQYLPQAAACVLVFVDGRFRPSLSSVDDLPAGLTAVSLASVIESNPAVLEPHLGHYLNMQRDPFVALNTAFLEDGAFVHIAKNAVLENPVYVLFFSASSEAPLMYHPRNLIIAEPGSQAAVVEDYVASDTSVGFANAATELIAGDDAVISHYLIEREHQRAFNVSTLCIQQSRNANVSSHSVLLGGALVRNNVHPVFAGEGGECLINGLFMGSGRELLDNYMLVEHASPHCSSRQFYNGILDDHAHGVFHGRIVVHKDAQKTDAKQTNRNLLLSDNAQIDTKPQLEIFADDVKCTHGATIGQIEEDALFYLRSRGLSEETARQLLLLAFASECLDRMKEPAVREHLEKLIRAHMLETAGSAPNRERATGESVLTEREWEEVG